MAAAGGGGGVGPRAGETEVFRIIPEVGKCYQHIEATRSVYIGNANHRYFSTNKPRYVGKFIRQVRQGWGDGMDVTDIFNDGINENRVEYSYEGFTCFIEVPCYQTLVKNIYEQKTGQSGIPGTGPANLIGQFMGIAKGGIKKEGNKKGGRRKNTRRAGRKSKKTRSKSRN